MDISPLLYFLLFGLVMSAMILMVKLSDALGECGELRARLRHLKGERPEEPPEWL